MVMKGVDQNRITKQMQWLKPESIWTYFSLFWAKSWFWLFFSKRQILWKSTKCHYLEYLASNHKNNDTFFSSTLKVEENKVLSDFDFEANWRSYGHFVIFQDLTFSVPKRKVRARWKIIKQSWFWCLWTHKSIFVKSASGEIERLLLMDLERLLFIFLSPHSQMFHQYCCEFRDTKIRTVWWFFTLPALSFLVQKKLNLEKWQNDRSSANLPQNQNLRVLYFLQLLMLKKRKCCYFYDYRPYIWGIDILLIHTKLAI